MRSFSMTGKKLFFAALSGLFLGIFGHFTSAWGQLSPLADIQAVVSGGYHSCALGTSGGVACWGDNSAGQLGDDSQTDRSTPVGVWGLTSGVSAIAAGFNHNCVLISGGVKCWGDNSDGQLGDNSTTERHTPVAVSTLSSGVVAIAGGRYHTCALLSGGGVKCWGLNSNGQLGNGSTTDSLVPVDVSGLASGVTGIAAGYYHTCAVYTGGAAKCWGLNENGQLGNNSTTESHVPVDVSTLTSGVANVATGAYYSCARTTGGGVKCWGSSPYGQLGNSVNTDSLVPVDVSGLGSGIASIASRAYHTCAVTTTGGAKCWGRDDTAQLGNNSLNEAWWFPVDVAGLGSGVASIAPGMRHTCALTTAGEVKCWGYGLQGQLGDNQVRKRHTPTDVSALTSGVSALAAGWGQTCALTAGGAAKCWGWNPTAQLGDGTKNQRLTPVDVSGLGSGATDITTGYNHSCAVSGGGAKCWGRGWEGMLGNGGQNEQSTPVDVSTLTSGVSRVAAGVGSFHTCALTTGGGVKCWGANWHGQLGDSSTTNRLSPVDVTGLASGVGALAVGENHTCAISGGGAKCWGVNWNGTLGNGSTTNSSIPVDVSGLTSGVSAIAAGRNHTCALVGGGVKCWGVNWAGQLGNNSYTNSLVPVDVSGLASGVSAIALGENHSCALTTVGGVKCWGQNEHGALGNTGNIYSSVPVDVSGLTSGISSIVAGSRHTCARSTSGGVRCWGANELGQLGDGTGGLAMVPVSVVLAPPTLPITGIASVEAGLHHTCAITTGGGLKCWGVNWSGHLGDGTTTTRYTASDVTGLGSGVTGVAAGFYHTCAVVSGGAKCWGDNDYGQLGDNSTAMHTAPTDVSGLGSGVQAIAAGLYHSCALTTGGGVKCWGANGNGQLGDNSTTQRLIPVDVVGLTSGVAAISAGYYHTCARTTAGAVKCWGRNGDGQLGDSSTTQRLAPVDVTSLSSGVTNILARGYHSCARTAGGGMKCWGSNSWGLLGNSSWTGTSAPVDVSGLTTGVESIGGGSYHTCAVTSSGVAKCWGRNENHELGSHPGSVSNIPVNVAGLAGGAEAITGGWGHTCALTTSGGVVCWGYSADGRLGDNIKTRRLVPTDVSGLSSGMTKVAAGYGHNCALGSGGGVKCWGNNAFGQLGDTTTSQRLTPVDVTGLAGMTQVTTGNGHTCALTSGGGAKCWGKGFQGQIGYGGQADQVTPVDVSGLTSGVTTVSAGNHHTCAVTSSGAAQCWGENWGGQLGDNSTTQRLVPVGVSGLGSGVATLAAGQFHTCAATTAGGVKCWGDNPSGQLGDNSTTRRLIPMDVVGLGSGSGVTAVAAGYGHTCALISGGAVKCWGSNVSGQLGTGSTTNSLIPVDVSGLGSGVLAIAAGWYHTCALITGGGVKCWGDNYSAQLGDNSRTDRLIPVDVWGLTSGASALAAGYEHSCAVVGGALKCWGQNAYAQLGNGYGGLRIMPGDVLISGPEAPTIGTAIAGNAGALVSFTPAFNGGAAIDNYRVTCNPGGVTATGTSSPVNVTGLTNGTAYTCTVAAHNSVGWSAQSAESNSFTPQTVTAPSAPQNVVGTPGNGQIGITFATPLYAGTVTGGGPATIVSYTATCGSQTATGASSPLTVTGLTNGTAYACTVTATNNEPLTGPPGTAAAVTPRTVPAAPTIGAATAGNGSASVSFSANSNGGAAIDNYRATCNPGGIIASASVGPINVSGLSNGTAYTCTVAAHNVAGWSSESSASNSVTPSAPTAPSAPLNLVGSGGNAQISVAFLAPTSPGTLAGGAAAVITGYTANCGGPTQGGAGSPLVVTGLTNGNTYTCTVTATNSAGLTGPAAGAAPVTLATVLPGAPTGLSATAKRRGAQLQFTAPLAGLPIVSYTATCSATGQPTRNASGPVSPLAVRNLVADLLYTCSVHATNSLGNGPESATTTVTPRPAASSAPLLMLLD